MRRSYNSNQPSITASFQRRKPDKLDTERRATVADTGERIASLSPGVAGAGLSRKRPIQRVAGVAGGAGVAGRSRSSMLESTGVKRSRASLLESSDAKKPIYRVSNSSLGGPGASRQSTAASREPSVSSKADLGPPLSEEQEKIVELICTKRHNVFFTGEAGTGKSLIIKNVVHRFKKSGISCHVTAPTGLAAVNIGGTTTYRWSGLGLMQGSVEECVRKISKSQETKTRWNDTKVLVIDEVSMFPADKFAKLDAIARGVRNKDRPFGGIQLVLTGDFFQLPPVGQTGKFLFSTPTFQQAIRHRVQLKKVFRQQGDVSLTEMLRKLRFSEPSDHAELMTFFRALERELDHSDGIAATVLEPRNDAVNARNTTELHKLPYIHHPRPGHC